MFDIDQFIDSCESMKINEWDYEVGMEGIGIVYNIKRIIQKLITFIKKLIAKINDKIRYSGGLIYKWPKQLPIEAMVKILRNENDILHTNLSQLISNIDKTIKDTPSSNDIRFTYIDRIISNFYDVDHAMAIHISEADTLLKKIADATDSQYVNNDNPRFTSKADRILTDSINKSNKKNRAVIRKTHIDGRKRTVSFHAPLEDIQFVTSDIEKRVKIYDSYFKKIETANFNNVTDATRQNLLKILSNVIGAEYKLMQNCTCLYRTITSDILHQSDDDDDDDFEYDEFDS